MIILSFKMGFLNCNQITVTANPTDLDFMAFFWYIDKINLRVLDILKTNI